MTSIQAYLEPFFALPGNLECRGLQRSQRSGVPDSINIYAVQAAPVKAAALRLGPSRAEGGAEYGGQTHSGTSAIMSTHKFTYCLRCVSPAKIVALIPEWKTLFTRQPDEIHEHCTF